MSRRWLLFLVGLVYGLWLANVGDGLAGGGDGAMIPTYVFGSPLFIPLLTFAPLAIWPTVGILLGKLERRGSSRLFKGIMTFHYLGIVLYLGFLGDWQRLGTSMTRNGYLPVAV